MTKRNEIKRTRKYMRLDADLLTGLAHRDIANQSAAYWMAHAMDYCHLACTTNTNWLHMRHINDARSHLAAARECRLEAQADGWRLP